MKVQSVLRMITIWSLLIFSSQTLQANEKSLPASDYSAAVLNKWMVLQIRLMATTPHRLNGPFVRSFAYTSLATYYSITPAYHAPLGFGYRQAQLTNLQAMPEIGSEKFHWPSSLNAAHAFMSRSMFPAASTDNKKAIDSLEAALNSSFGSEANTITLQASAQYGKKVAQQIFDWAELDGFRHTPIKFLKPLGREKWASPPNYNGPDIPYYGGLRMMVPGSLENTQPPDPPAYSEDIKSVFYKQAKEVFNISQSPTGEQKKITLFWRDVNPGVTMVGHWLNVLRQLIEKEKLALDKAAYAYALCGIALNDTWIGCSRTRKHYNLAHPINYIREVMGYKDWLSFLPTWPTPEYTAIAAAAAGAVCTVLAEVFGDSYTLTDHTYDNAGLGPRTYYSFTNMAKEAAESQIYGGTHYRFSVEAGLQQGRAVANNFLQLLLKNNAK